MIRSITERISAYRKHREESYPLQERSRWLSFLVHSRIGEIFFVFCVLMSICIYVYFTHMGIVVKTGMDSPEISYSVILFYESGSFFLTSYCLALYIWIYFYKQDGR